MLKEQKDAHLSRAMTMYGDYLLRVCFTYVKDWTVAEDLVQDTFVKYYEKMEQFREEASIKTYLYRIAINNCHSYLSRWRYKKIQVIDYWSKFKSLSNNPEKEVLMGETDALLVASIEKLPMISLKDVAELLKLPENTVKTRLRRARQMVGITLLEEGFEYGSDS